MSSTGPSMTFLYLHSLTQKTGLRVSPKPFHSDQHLVAKLADHCASLTQDSSTTRAETWLCHSEKPAAKVPTKTLMATTCEPCIQVTGTRGSKGWGGGMSWCRVPAGAEMILVQTVRQDRLQWEDGWAQTARRSGAGDPGAMGTGSFAE